MSCKQLTCSSELKEAPGSIQAVIREGPHPAWHRGGSRHSDSEPHVPGAWTGGERYAEGIAGLGPAAGGRGHRPSARESEEASWMAGRVPTELRERITLGRGRLGEQARRQKPVPTVQEAGGWGLNGWRAGKEEF